MLEQIEQEKLVKTLVVIFVIEWLLLAINPHYRSDWLLENVLVILYFPLMIWLRKKVAFSNLSYVLMFAFMFLHEIGSHYTYAEVPYDQWFKSINGITFNELVGFERNHFDRLIHFLYGVLFFIPFREIYVQRANLTGFWSYFFPYMVIVSTTVLYEQIEWAAAEIFGGELGMAYLGTQGDVWDGHKDMGLASLGALSTLLLSAYLNKKKAVAS
jgi:putative membrane protein